MNKISKLAIALSALYCAITLTSCNEDDDHDFYEEHIVGSWTRGEAGLWRETVTFYDSDKFSGQRAKTDESGNETISEFLGECDYGDMQLTIDYLSGTWLDGPGIYNVEISGDMLMLNNGGDTYRFYRISPGTDNTPQQPETNVIDKTLIIGRWQPDGEPDETFEYTSEATWTYTYRGEIAATGTYSISGNVLTTIQTDGHAEHATIIELTTDRLRLHWQEDDYTELYTRIS